jgi:two-component system, cell cycle sensor histidine kinase and response regulator CckA
VGDVDALERLLMNLVVNALDAIDDTGRIRIAVDRVEPTGSGPSECRLVVEDTGHGIPPEERERIFDPFFTTKPEGRGSGLGLSTVFGIVAEMEGRMEVRSEVGRGTTFELRFPLGGDDMPGDVPVPCPSVPSGTEETSAQSPPRHPLPPGDGVLVIEDDENLARRRILDRGGWTVHEAHGPAQARALVADGGLDDREREGIRVVLCDVVLPETHGPELVEELRARLPGVPVVFMSGYSGDELRGRISDDAAAFLGQPFSPGELLEVVRGARGR